MGPPRRTCLWIAIGLASLFFLAGCTPQTQPRGRVLLIGIDGATLRVARPLLEKGRLPQLAAIAHRGISGRLRSFRPLFSPAIWASIATGKSRDKHGIPSFTRKDHQGRNQLFQSTDRKTHALWNIASDASLTVGVVNWWTTFPPEKIEGIMVSDHALPGQLEDWARTFKAVVGNEGHLVFPLQWTQKLVSLLAMDEPLTNVEDPIPGKSNRPAWVRGANLSKAYDRDQTVVRVALAIEHQLQPDLLMVFLKGIDNVSHMLWGALEPASLYPDMVLFTASERANAAEALYRYYEYTDALIGLLVKRYDSDDLVMVVSDHGFESGVPMTGLTGMHNSQKALDGVIFARGHGILPGGEPEGMTVNDVTPTVLAWLGLPVADDMDGVPASFLGGERVERIATYDTHPVERIGPGSSGVEHEILEQLRALGYIE